MTQGVSLLIDEGANISDTGISGLAALVMAGAAGAAGA